MDYQIHSIKLKTIPELTYDFQPIYNQEVKNMPSQNKILEETINEVRNIVTEQNLKDLMTLRQEITDLRERLDILVDHFTFNNTDLRDKYKVLKFKNREGN